jgi:PAP2 superfamily protein
MFFVSAVLALQLAGAGSAPAEVVQSQPAALQPDAGAQELVDVAVEHAGDEQKADREQPRTDSEKQKADAQEPPTPAHTGFHALFGNLVEDIKHLPSMQNAYIAAAGGGLAIAAHPADVTFNARLRSHYDGVNIAFAPGKYVGDTVEQVAFSLGTYAYGRAFDQPKVSHLGMDLIQAQLITEMIIEPIKFATGRERPDGSNRQSFPSGHAAVTFATATVIERHLGWRKSILAYTVASYVAASRLHDNRHYLSDVIFGAAVGAIAGRTVVHHRADYWAFAPVSVPGGVALLVTRVK